MSTTAVSYREAIVEDVPEMDRIHMTDPRWPGDPRKAPYLEGKHHPQKALPPRVIYVAMDGDSMVGYIGGHLTRRYDCDGELQYLYVVREHRRTGVASGLLRRLARWFLAHDASQICVDVVPDNAPARAFYTKYGAAELNSHWLVWNDINGVLTER